MKAIVRYVFRAILVPLLLAACLAQAQTPPAPSTPGSISGIVRESTTGAPMAGVTVVIFEHGVMTKQINTEGSGGYSCSNVEPGEVRIRVQPRLGMSGIAIVEKTVSIAPAQDLKFDIAVPAPGQISGKITDENKKPLKGIPILLISAEYSHGALRYVPSANGASNENGITNEDGEYTIPRVEPGRAFYVLATRRLQPTKPISDVSTDPELRKPILIPAYYPGVDVIESATRLVLAPGEKRELIDIQMRTARSRCLEGAVRAPDGATALRFEIGEAEPAIWGVGNLAPLPPPTKDPPGDLVSTSIRAPGSLTGPEGRIRICDLHPGDYWLNAYANVEKSVHFGNEIVSIGDKDLSGIVVTATPHLTLHGDVVWDNAPPAKPVSTRLQIGFTGTSVRGANASISFSRTLPSPFTIPLWNQDHIIVVSGLPADAYVNDITYGGRSVLNEVFQPGPSPAADGLRIVLARDGARVSVKAADKDGNAIADASVILMPANAPTEAAMASAMITGLTDSFGTWSSALIAPGKYYVVATTTPVNMGVETIAKLWRMRRSSDLVELGANATVQVSRIPE